MLVACFQNEFLLNLAGFTRKNEPIFWVWDLLGNPKPLLKSHISPLFPSQKYPADEFSQGLRQLRTYHARQPRKPVATGVEDVLKRKFYSFVVRTQTSSIILPYSEAGALYTSWLFEQIGAPEDDLVPGLGWVIPVFGNVISWPFIPSSQRAQKMYADSTTQSLQLLSTNDSCKSMPQLQSAQKTPV